MASRAGTANKQDSSFKHTTMYSGPRVVCHSMHFTVTTTIHIHFHFPSRSHVQTDSKVFIRRLCHVFPNHMRIDILFSILAVSILGFTPSATHTVSNMLSSRREKQWPTPQLAHPHPAQSPAHEEQLEHAQGPIVTGIWGGGLV